MAYLEVKERGAASGWSSSRLPLCCFWMNRPQDWTPTLQTVSSVSCTSTTQLGIFTIYCYIFCKTMDANTFPLCVSRLSRRGKTVIFSIHQPRYSIFRQFDHLTLMHRGEVVYAGAAGHALEYFTNLGVCVLTIKGAGY